MPATYRIFDSLDHPCGPSAATEWDLIDHLRTLQEEAADQGGRMSYAIAKVLPCGTVTFDY